jgi:hypothetical protein
MTSLSTASVDWFAGDLNGETLLPSLDIRDIMQFYRNRSPSGRMLKFVLDLDRMDRWCVDFSSEMPGVVDQEVLDGLERVLQDYREVLGEVPQDLLPVLTRLTTSRSLYVLHYVAQNHPEFIDRFISLLEQNSTGNDPAAVDIRTIRRRLDAFYRAKLLQEVFSGERLQRITKIMGSYQ